jgi:hypothetical protein
VVIIVGVTAIAVGVGESLLEGGGSRAAVAVDSGVVCTDTVDTRCCEGGGPVGVKKGKKKKLTFLSSSSGCTCIVYQAGGGNSVSGGVGSPAARCRRGGPGHRSSSSLVGHGVVVAGTWQARDVTCDRCVTPEVGAGTVLMHVMLPHLMT